VGLKFLREVLQKLVFLSPGILRVIKVLKLRPPVLKSLTEVLRPSLTNFFTVLASRTLTVVDKLCQLCHYPLPRFINWPLNKRQPIPTNRFGQRHGASAIHAITTSNKSLLAVQLDNESRQKRRTDEAGVSPVVSSIVAPRVVVPVGDVPANVVSNKVPEYKDTVVMPEYKVPEYIDDKEDAGESMHGQTA
jgi:hypothetical protein